jgi:hypothetical protein
MNQLSIGLQSSMDIPDPDYLQHNEDDSQAVAVLS